jgi:hypothetical protein
VVTDAAPAPDWSALADGRLHRLRQGRDYAGDVRLHIRDARMAAAKLGRHAIVTRDDLGNVAYLWVQFVDGEIGGDEPCARCGGVDLMRQAPGIVVCARCDAVFEVTAAPPAETGAPAEDVPEPQSAGRVAAASARAGVRSLWRAGMSDTVTVDARDLLRDQGFSDVLSRVLDARATRLDVARLWTLWEATGIGAAAGGGALAVGSVWAGGAAFLCLALAERAGEPREATIVDHPRYREHAELLADGQLTDVLEFIDELGADVLADDVRGAAETLTARRYGVVHLDLADGDEVTDALALLHDALEPGAAVVIEDYRVPIESKRRSSAVARGVDQFLEFNDGYVVWRTPTRQALLLKRGA